MDTLDTEEKEILEAFERGELKRAIDAKAIRQRHREYAEAMLREDARMIDVRFSSRTLHGLRERALIEGVS
uniref:Uncharacterized protein n=1 Tax=Candidatus Kentrum sp. LPFa TaxID=2126335 RepID=A0A450W2W5_9GAMM|nr:MAG: hypothetical protein BECKLPF1236A_GA0070988_100545 [Candidatus Kentron sp. LPFa]VFK27587.1 MAG: hypothetical protein BECKLPF1236C_GA0070990_100495 [Candidatus Kentron sp. LPFa]